MCCCVLFSQAQQYDIPLNYNLSQEVLVVKSNSDSLFHTGQRPYNQWFLSKKTFDNTFKDTSDYYYDATVLLYQKHLLEIHKKDIHIGMDLLLDFYLGRKGGYDFSEVDGKVSGNSRGFRIVANIGKNVSFETRFYENQFFFADFLDSIMDARHVVSGIGRHKSFKEIGYDAGYSMGSVSYKINDQINIKFGHDKLFIGHGYRSLLLSDNASNYPLLTANFRSKNQKWFYSSTYAWMQSLTRSLTTVSTEALFKRKNGNFHYLSFKPNSHLELGLFEATIYNVYSDSSGIEKPSPTFYNPIIGINTAVEGLQNKNNSLIGLSASYFFRDFQFYGQLAMDNINKIGFQLGTKWFELFNLKRNWVQLEFNTVPSYMYSTTTINILQNYTHMNQELAHPLGASFKELLFLYHFEWNRWFTDFHFIYANRVRGDLRQFGENILIASDHTLISQTTYQNVNTYYWTIEGGYSFNIKTRLQVFGQVTQRILNNLDNSNANQKDFFFQMGIRCYLNNYYLDL